MVSTPRISALMILVIIISLVAAVFATTMGSLNNSYSSSVNESDLEAYNKLNNISRDAEDVKSNIEDLSEDSGLFDVIGAYFAAGYKSFRVSTQSFDAMDDIVSKGIEDSPVGDSSTVQQIRLAIISILVIIVFITIGLSIIFKWWV